MGFIESFVEIFKVDMAVAIIFFCVLVYFQTLKLDKKLLKARLFLNNNATMERTWMYISIAGASFAFNAIIKIAGRFTGTVNIFNGYYLVELTQLIFLIAFFFAVHNWYLFISMNCRPSKSANC
jgi:hypothetical protein